MLAVPVINGQVPHINIKPFGKKRTGADCTVRSIKYSVLAMPYPLYRSNVYTVFSSYMVQLFTSRMKVFMRRLK